MKLRSIAILFVTHCTVAVVGIAAGIYVLPILTAPLAPSEAKIKTLSPHAQYSAQFRKDLQDSDYLHWGEGVVSVGPDYVTLMGKLAPGPDYKLYLSPEYVVTEADFMRLKNTMVQVGDVRTFENFIVEVPATIDPSKFNSVIIWCEAFSQFITSAKYR